MPNSIHTYGDNNISLQDVQARDINIYTGGESPEIREIKDSLAEHFARLIQDLGKIDENRETEDEGLGDIDDGMFDDVNWRQLLMAIERNKCVLFIGQGVALDENGKCIHDEFYETTSSANIPYDPVEGFFLPDQNSRFELRLQAMDFYDRDTFLKKNEIGYGLLKQLAQIPLSLTVSICPDDTLNAINEKYNKKAQFLYYKGIKQEAPTPSKEFPVIYNLLGFPSEESDYVFTHEDFYKYLDAKQEVKIPYNIETIVQSAYHYVFIGVDFDKWYNRLLLYALKLNIGAGSFALNTKEFRDLSEEFIRSQFQVSLVKNNIADFVKVLVSKCKEKGLYETLIDSFIQNTMNDIKDLQRKAIDTKTAQELTKIECNVESIEELIKNFIVDGEA